MIMIRLFVSVVFVFLCGERPLCQESDKWAKKFPPENVLLLKVTSDERVTTPIKELHPFPSDKFSIITRWTPYLSGLSEPLVIDERLVIKFDLQPNVL